MNKEAFIAGFVKIAKYDREIRSILDEISRPFKDRPVKNTDYMQKRRGFDWMDLLDADREVGNKLNLALPADKFKELFNTFQKKDITVQEFINYWNTHGAGGNPITFPSDEHSALQQRLVDNKPIYTTRIQNELDKYEFGQPYMANLLGGNYRLKLTGKDAYTRLKDHPFFKELTKAQKSQIGNNPYQVLKFKGIDRPAQLIEGESAIMAI